MLLQVQGDSNTEQLANDLQDAPEVVRESQELGISIES